MSFYPHRLALRRRQESAAERDANLIRVFRLIAREQMARSSLESLFKFKTNNLQTVIFVQQDICSLANEKSYSNSNECHICEAIIISRIIIRWTASVDRPDWFNVCFAVNLVYRYFSHWMAMQLSWVAHFPCCFCYLTPRDEWSKESSWWMSHPGHRM